jgi:hypothetical protein
MNQKGRLQKYDNRVPGPGSCTYFEIKMQIRALLILELIAIETTIAKKHILPLELEIG